MTPDLDPGLWDTLRLGPIPEGERVGQGPGTTIGDVHWLIKE